MAARMVLRAALQQTRCTVPFFAQCQRSKSYIPETSLSRPPWPELPLVNKEEEQKRHQAVVQKVNTLIENREYGRLFAVVHFASRQWKVTNEDLILIENHIEAECGDRIVLEKVLLVGGEDFTLIGKPLLSRDLVRVEATVIEKTESWPMVHMRFWKRHRFQKKRTIIQPQTVLRINSIEVSPRLT
ncbi:39S ribosomal protein L21, mitochondrial [Colossoma macropomum]|uniref:39S ribosomal protein L21, mitochondrial n=1 Tax=Colossoma macropomum TaxID=42526 RepID=UPI001864FA6F|nr:39S ribosomal protein L21, mitochondrial [Colossoma macropomum]